MHPRSSAAPEVVVSAILKLAFMTGAVYLHARGSRWYDLHMAACARIADLERILRWERQQYDEIVEQLGRERMANDADSHRMEIEALEVALTVTQKDARTSNALASAALDLGDKIDALTDELRKLRGTPAPVSPACGDEPMIWVGDEARHDQG